VSIEAIVVREGVEASIVTGLVYLAGYGGAGVIGPVSRVETR